MTTLIDVPRGLKGVAAAETSIGDVRGGEGFYHYGAYNATRLARERTLEEAWFLVRTGKLPDATELADFTHSVAAHRAIPQEVVAALPTVARLASNEQPLEALRAAYELFALAKHYRPWLDLDADTLDGQALETAAVFAPIVVALHRLARGEEPIAPRADLGHAANYLYMLEGREPSSERVRALEAYLISTIDHGFNASTFTARVVASTGADVASAVIAAIGALSGPLHGGAPSRVLDMLDAIGEPAGAEAWLREALERGEKLMGFGHPVYRTTDPRNVMLKEVAAELGSERLEFAAHVEETAERLLHERRPDHPLYANVEFYASIVLDAIGLPRALFTPTFAVSRVIGWTAHIVEQTTNNAILRPSARYVGPEPVS
ncbi:MAG TPA: citrate synthase [Kofleriaceae bacterium]|nr:citrate synthase [Kofleriaceae bacterium]